MVVCLFVGVCDVVLFVVLIGFARENFIVDEDVGTVDLVVTILEGSIPVGETRVVTLSTFGGTAQGSYSTITSCSYTKQSSC